MRQAWIRRFVAPMVAVMTLMLALGTAFATPVSATVGVTGYQVRTGAMTDLPQSSVGTAVVADAYCPSGKVPVSGGAFSTIRNVHRHVHPDR